MMEIFRLLYSRLLAGEDTVLATIVSSSGSTPRRKGARMLVSKDGLLNGTIGGGAAEFAAERLAREALEEKKSFIKSFEMSNKDAEGLGMVCGGSIEVLFQYFSGTDTEARELLEVITGADANSTDCYLTTEYSDVSWKMYIGKPVTKTDGKSYYTERLSAARRAVIFGGGHVAQALSPVLFHIGLRHIILDDRSEFCHSGLFPYAEDTIVADLASFTDSVTVTPSDFVLIMTRGHSLDYEVLSQTLKTGACYIGMIGSRNKIAKTFELLRSQCFTEYDLNRVHAPIGLPISAETPEEIAISIAAELIKVNAGLRKQEE